jgi:hypothetical protein
MTISLTVIWLCHVHLSGYVTYNDMIMSRTLVWLEWSDCVMYSNLIMSRTFIWIKVITKLPNSEQSYKGKVKTHNYINRQNQSTINVTINMLSMSHIPSDFIMYPTLLWLCHHQLSFFICIVQWVCHLGFCHLQWSNYVI